MPPSPAQCPGARRGAGGSLEHVAQLTIYLSDIRHREATRTARAEFFKEPAPAASVIGGVDLAFDDLLVEIDAIAVLPEG